MNPLPQRKKSPEEIAKLRESLGIPPPPGDAEAEEAWPDPPPPDPNKPSAEPPAHAMAPVDDAPPPVRVRPQVHSFKRSERRPQPEVEALRESNTSPAEPVGLPQPPVIPVAATRQPKPIRPLQKPAPAAAPTSAAFAPAPPAADSKLPAHRHSERELAEARRRDALAVMAHGTYQLPGAAHPILLAIGYVLAIGGAAAPTLLDWLARLTGDYQMGMACSQGYHLLTVGTLAALPIAGFIFFRKTLSRHHAAFIAIIVFFALVFAILHYFSQLRHAT